MDTSIDALVLLATVYPIGFLILAFERSHPQVPRVSSLMGTRAAIAVTAVFVVLELLFLTAAAAATVVAVWAAVDGRTHLSTIEAAILIGPGAGLALVVLGRAFRAVFDEFLNYVDAARSTRN